MTDPTLLFDISCLSGCYHAPPGSHYGIGRVAGGFARGLAEIFGGEMGICSGYFAAEAALLLRREYPGLEEYYIEETAHAWERRVMEWVNLNEPDGGIRPDLISKVKRNVWRAYDDRLRWQLTQRTRRTYRNAKLIHSEFGVPVVDRCPGARRVYTMHDLIAIRTETTPREVRLTLEAALKREWQKGAFFCCNSQHTADDLMNLLKAGPDRIRGVSLGVESVFRPVNEPDRLARWKSRLGLQPAQRYVVAHTGDFTRKNLAGVILAVHAARLQGSPDLMLVFAGYPKQLKNRFQESIPPAVNWETFVRFTGSLADSDFPVIFSGADVMMFLSWAEGFGLPPLEAMACGLPVISSNRTSLPEIIGDSGLLVDPSNQAEVNESLQRLLSDPGLRKELAVKGEARAARFTWSHVGRRVADVWQDALAH